MSALGYRELRVWQRGMDLVVACYHVVRRFPDHERYGLTSQIRRSAASVPANIAEGSARRHRAEYVHHLSYARASLAELETHLLLAERLRYLAPDALEPILTASNELGRMLTAMLRKLDAQRLGSRDQGAGTRD